MKFKRFDIVVHRPTFNGNMPTLLVILGYDEKRKKYKCFDMGIYDEGLNKICFCLEEDLEFFNYKRFEEDVIMYRNLINSDDFDELYYTVYELEGKNYTKVRNAYKHFKNQDNY